MAKVLLVGFAVAVAAVALVLGLRGTPGDSAPSPVKDRAAPLAKADACDAEATPQTFAARFVATKPGQILCLGAGDYGVFTGTHEPGRVTLRGARGARARLRLDLSAASNLVLDGFAISDARLSGETHDVTIRNSKFSGPIVIDGLFNANVLLDHNTHVGIDANESGPPARIHLAYSGAAPSGVTVRNSLLAGGDADGIQTGVGMNIVGNEFRDIVERGSNHTDSIQLIGAPRTVVRGNYIHGSSSGIVAYDGVERALIEDNVVDLPGRPLGIELFSDKGSVIRHNTLPYGACGGNVPCGIIEVNRKPGDAPGRGTVVVSNVATEISVQNGSTVAKRHGNIVRVGATQSDLLGSPVLGSGKRPRRYAAFALAGKKGIPPEAGIRPDARVGR